MNDEEARETQKVAELLSITKIARDDTIKEIDRLHKLLMRLYLIVIGVSATLLVVYLLGIHQTDLLSCKRSNVVRYSQLGEYQYAKDAADARFKARKVELKQHQYALAKINLIAANKFLIDAKRIHVTIISCNGLFPSAI